jgi:type I restriction enzyme S subunit
MTVAKGTSSVVPRLRLAEFRNDKGWVAWNLGRLVEFSSGGTPSKAEPSYWRGAIPWISASSMYETNIADSDLKVTPLAIGNGTRLAPKGTILVLVRGSMLFNRVPMGITVADVAFNQDVKALKIDRGINAAFLLNQLIAVSPRIPINETGIGAGKIEMDTLADLPIYLPSEAEQQKIADCLTSLDEVIAAQGRKVEALKAHKRGLMQQLFPREGETVPRLRFPEFRDGPEWEERDVGDVFRVTRGDVLAMPLVMDQRSSEAPYPVYSSQTKNQGLAGYYSKFLYEDAITWTTDGANAGEVNYRVGKFYCTNVCGVLLNSEGYANLCIAALLNTVTRSHVSYVGNPKLMNGVMSKITIPLPSIAEQQRIADCLSSLDTRIATESNQLDALKTHKQGLMQQLFPSPVEASA